MIKSPSFAVAVGILWDSVKSQSITMQAGQKNSRWPEISYWRPKLKMEDNKWDNVRDIYHRWFEIDLAAIWMCLSNYIDSQRQWQEVMLNMKVLECHGSSSAGVSCEVSNKSQSLTIMSQSLHLHDYGSVIDDENTKIPPQYFLRSTASNVNYKNKIHMKNVKHFQVGNILKLLEDSFSIMFVICRIFGRRSAVHFVSAALLCPTKKWQYQG